MTQDELKRGNKLNEIISILRPEIEGLSDIQKYAQDYTGYYSAHLVVPCNQSDNGILEHYFEMSHFKEIEGLEDKVNEATMQYVDNLREILKSALINAEVELDSL